VLSAFKQESVLKENCVESSPCGIVTVYRRGRRVATHLREPHGVPVAAAAALLGSLQGKYFSLAERKQADLFNGMHDETAAAETNKTG